MQNQKVSIKIKAFISFIIPLLYYSMFLPIWNGKEFQINTIVIVNIIQIVAFILAVINLYLVFIKKKKSNQIVFTVFTVISAFLLCFFGFFFVENLMGIPPIPPQD